MFCSHGFELMGCRNRHCDTRTRDQLENHFCPDNHSLGAFNYAPLIVDEAVGSDAPWSVPAAFASAVAGLIVTARLLSVQDGFVPTLVLLVLTAYLIGAGTVRFRRVSVDGRESAERYGAFAGLTRVFGLLLTLLFVCTAASLSLDLLAVRALGDDAHHGAVEGDESFWHPGSRGRKTVTPAEPEEL